MPEPLTAAQVFSEYQIQVGTLSGTADAIADKIQAIQTGHPDQPLTQADLTAVTLLTAQQTTTLQAIQKLSYVTAMTLDHTSDVNVLVQTLNGIVTNLTATQTKLANIGKAVQQVGNVLSGLSGLIPKLLALGHTGT